MRGNLHVARHAVFRSALIAATFESRNAGNRHRAITFERDSTVRVAFDIAQVLAFAYIVRRVRANHYLEKRIEDPCIQRIVERDAEFPRTDVRDRRCILEPASDLGVIRPAGRKNIAATLRWNKQIIRQVRSPESATTED